MARFLMDQADARPAGDAVFVPRRGSDGRLSHLRLSYRELEQETAAWAGYLRHKGIRRGFRTLVLVRPGLPLIGLTFALFRLGAVPVVIDPGMGLGAFLACVRRTRPEALVGIPLGVLIRRLFFGTFRSVRVTVRVPSGLDARCPSGYLDGELAPVAPSEPAAILFTSGSTGMPKGVVYTGAHFEAQIASVRSTYGIVPGEVDLTLLPVFALFNPALGMASVVPEIDPRRPAALDPRKIVEAIQLRGVTNAFGAPPLWRRLADYCEATGTRLESVRRLLLAGAPVPPKLIGRLRALLPKGEVHTPYGATECLPVASLDGRSILEAAAACPPESGPGVCVGRPVAGMRVCILSGEEPGGVLKPAPLGAVGEIVVSGPVVTGQYDQLPEQTRRAKFEASIEPGESSVLWHRMGDAGRLDSEGRLWVYGRLAEAVELPEGRLFSEQVEPAFQAHPEVQRSALIGLKEAGEIRPVVVIEPRSGELPDRPQAERLVEELARMRPDCSPAMRVRGVFFCRRFPVDVRHNAKIHRLTLARWASKGRLGRYYPFPHVPPAVGGSGVSVSPAGT